MSFEFRADEALRESIHRIAGKEIEKIRDYASGSIGRSRDEMVHEIRKSLTKLRTILRLVRPAIDEKIYRRENTAFRDIARPLTDVRDAGDPRRSARQDGEDPSGSESQGWSFGDWTQLITQAATGLSPETVRRGGERDRCGTALPGGSNPVTTRIVRRVSRKQFAVLDCGSDQHFRHK